MRWFLHSLILLTLPIVAASATIAPQSAEQAFVAAKAEAVAQHKNIFLVFGASWCPPCRQLETFLEDVEMRPILEKYFVIASLNVYEEHGKHPELNTPGAEELLKSFGGESDGVPFLVFLDAQGKLLINSNRPVQGKSNGENVGYPVLPEEIDWFMTMLHNSLPSLSQADSQHIESWLRKKAAH
jgi:thioredoxin-related protein